MRRQLVTHFLHLLQHGLRFAHSILLHVEACEGAENGARPVNVPSRFQARQMTLSDFKGLSVKLLSILTSSLAESDRCHQSEVVCHT